MTRDCGQDCDTKLWDGIVARDCGTGLWHEIVDRIVARDCGTGLWDGIVRRNCETYFLLSERKMKNLIANLPALHYRYVRYIIRWWA